VELLRWAAVPLGLLLVTASLMDVGLTVLHIQAESPVSNKLNRAAWQLLATLSRPFGRRVQGRVLAWGLPLLTATTIGFWVVLHIAGFGLIFSPFVGRDGWFAGRFTETPGGFDAFYFSAVSFLTIGFGDLAPIHPLVRVLTVIEGAIGLLTISLSVTYLLSVYPMVTRKITVAAALNQDMAGRADGAAVAARYVATGKFDILGHRLHQLQGDLLALGQAHNSYPLLFYARPQQAHESFVRVLAMVQGLVSTLRYLLDPARYPDVVSDPRLGALEEALLYTLHGLGKSEHLARGNELDRARVLAQLENTL